MKDINAVFKKQGGWGLIRRYFQGGVLPIAIAQFILLGKNRTGLELLRLSTQLKMRQKLKRRYGYLLKSLEDEYNKNHLCKTSNKVWVCWFQGMDNAPTIVKRCYESLKENLVSREIILLTSENIKDYVQFPDYIIEKWEKGIITNTHMTDLLRLELLIKYGGTWIDATVYCSQEEREIPAYYFDSDLFVYQCLKPGRDGHSYINSSWFMTAKSNNKVLLAVRDLCYEYWKKNNDLKEYFLLHCFMGIVLEHFPKEWSNIMPVCNSTPHILLLRLFEAYDEEVYKVVAKMTPFHKLSYKYDSKNEELEGTYFAEMMKGKNEKEREREGVSECNHTCL